MKAKTDKQYRVVFTYLDDVNGSMRRVSGGTRWFNSREEAEQSTWVGAGSSVPCMSMDDAKIVEREMLAGEDFRMADGQPFVKRQTRFA